MELLLSSLCFIFFTQTLVSVAGGLSPAEQEAAYAALESISPEIEWRALYPDDICLFGPHGIVCDLFPDASGGFASHVTELNFGYLSEFSSNPECGPNASLPSFTSSSLPFLRRIFFFRCFQSIQTPIPDAFWTLPSSLEELLIHDNPSLIGSLSPRIVGLARLRRLIVSGTSISGKIPAEIGRIRDLEQLVLSRNRLKGPIPASTGDLRQLKILDLSGNALQGSIPIQIGLAAELVKLDLSSNQFSGEIPPEISLLDRVEFLDLSRNRLTGGIPPALGLMRGLRELHLSGNPLGGPIPEIWENLGGISGIGMAGLGLIGNIPASMGVFLPNICYLSLEGNFLEGELPEQLKLLERTAKEINVAENALRGRIPFSATFLDAIGGKLKVGGNPQLCIDREVAAYVRGRGSLGNVRFCNQTEISYPLSDSLSPSSPAKAASIPLFAANFFLFALFYIY